MMDFGALIGGVAMGPQQRMPTYEEYEERAIEDLVEAMAPGSEASYQPPGVLGTGVMGIQKYLHLPVKSLLNSIGWILWSCPPHEWRFDRQETHGRQMNLFFDPWVSG
jgi:hypothetical protein